MAAVAKRGAGGLQLRVVDIPTAGIEARPLSFEVSLANAVNIQRAELTLNARHLLVPDGSCSGDLTLIEEPGVGLNRYEPLVRRPSGLLLVRIVGKLRTAQEISAARRKCRQDEACEK